MSRRRQPREWIWNDADYESRKNSFWKIPRRLVTEGVWGDLWQSSNSRNVTSLLTVFAVHTWPGKHPLPGARSAPKPNWSGWSHVSHRRAAKLISINKDSVTRPVEILRDRDLMRLDDKRCGTRHYYQLCPSLYPAKDETFARFPASLLYGGAWSMLLSPAARHLYVVIACSDPIVSEESYLKAVDKQWEFEEICSEWSHYDVDDIVELQKMEYLGEIRANSGIVCRREVRHCSKLCRNTFRDALRELRTPMFPNPHGRPISLVAEGDGWLAVDRAAWNMGYDSDDLNWDLYVDDMQKRLFPWAFTRREKVKEASASRKETLERHAKVASLDAETQQKMKDISSGRLTPWETSQAIARVDSRLRGAGIVSSQRELGELLGVTEALVSTNIRIAGALLPATLSGLGIHPEEMSRNKLYELARKTCPKQ